jgi:hypothetical protein
MLHALEIALYLTIPSRDKGTREEVSKKLAI